MDVQKEKSQKRFGLNHCAKMCLAFFWLFFFGVIVSFKELHLSVVSELLCKSSFQI